MGVKAHAAQQPRLLQLHSSVIRAIIERFKVDLVVSYIILGIVMSRGKYEQDRIPRKSVKSGPNHRTYVCAEIRTIEWNFLAICTLLNNY